MGHVWDCRQFSRLGREFQVLRDRGDKGKIMKGLAYQAEEVEIHSEDLGSHQRVLSREVACD